MASNETPKYKLSVTEGTELQLSLLGPTGPTGPANVLDIGTVTPAETGVPAAASITGSSPTQLLHLTLPKGNTGTAATIAVGTTSTGAAGSDANVTNSGSSSAAVFNFTIPKGDKGNTGTLSLGTVETGNAGTAVIITNTGTAEAGQFNFTIPRGDTGLTGPAGPPNQLSVISTVTGAAGTEASVVVGGTAPSQTLSFTIPRGDTGLTGPPNQLSVNPTITGAAGSSASVLISGTAPSQTLTFTIPRGDTGATGSSGAESLLTGFASAAGTVAATDTVLAAVGKLDGNIALRATTASLYPYIGGKLLTYADEEAAIADPLISGGDLYRKTAGGVDYVNPDNVPSLDLRFAADKTLTARRGPTPVFSRASGATYVGSDGLIHGIDTSTTSNSISAGSKSFTLTATAGQDQLWRTGDAVEAANGTNWMFGTVTSYNASTQVLVCNMTSISGTGTFTSWRIGYRGPRFDHNPVSPFACRGLLIEEGRTNLYPRSDNFEDTFWTKDRSSIQTDATTAPDGTTTADKLIEDTTASNTHVVRSTITPSATPHTLSVFAKKGERNFICLRLGGLNDFFNLNTGVALTNINSPTITNYGNGWYRCTVTSSAGTQGSYRMSADGITDTYTGDGTSGIFIWGAQLEAGSFATSYIPTTTSTAARAADVCSIANTSSFWNGSEFTLFTNANWAAAGFDSYASNFNITSGFFGARRPNTNLAAGIIRSFGLTADIAFGISGSFTTGSMRMALAHSTGQQAGSLNGATAIQQNSAFVPSSNPPLNIGYSGTGAYINGHVLAIRYYKKRLPNAKLQALTA